MGFLDAFTKMAGSAINKANSFEFVKDKAPNQVGVYLMKHEGKVKYVGRAIEDRPGQSTKGLRKRLQEHWRGATNCKPELHKHRKEISVSTRTCATADEAKELEARLIREHDTVANGWNLRYED
jgi:excinuclease UvrABC nuclease subunit